MKEINDVIEVRAWVAPSGDVHYQSSTVIAPDMGGNNGRAIRIQWGDKKEQNDLIWSWGLDNNLPAVRESLIKENNIIGELLSTKATVTIGSGINFYRTRYIDGEEVKDFVPKPKWFSDLEMAMDVDDFLDRAANNLFKHANIFIRYIRDLEGNIKKMQVLDCRHVRAEKQDSKGRIRNYFWCGDWKSRNRAEFPIVKIPAYDPEKAALQNTFILHIGDSLFTDDYYCEPTWWFGRKWIELANRIPLFHLSNIQHGYLIRYHVEIPKDYFSDRTAAQQAMNDPNTLKSVREKEAQARIAFIETVNSLFAGEKKAGRALFTEYEINRQIQRDYPGVKITPLETDIQDEALIKLFAASNDANISGQGVHPALAAIQTQGKLSSGSEIQNAHTMYIATKTPKNRRLLAAPFKLIQKDIVQRNPKMASVLDDQIGWREIKITQLNQDKTGMQEVTSTVE